jgi:hypothetical protein
MAFTDPLALTIGGSVKNLVRIDSGRGQSEYSYTDSLMKITALIRNSTTKPGLDGRSKERHAISIRQTVFATATTAELVRNSTISIEHYSGDDVTAYDDLPIALATLQTAPNVLKLANFES